MQNGYIESFNGRFRDECLNEHWFETLHQARTEIAIWRRDYNEVRPHGSIGRIPPARFAGRSATDHARRQRRDQRMQLLADHRRSNQLGLAPMIDAVNSKNILGQINTDGQNRHGLPLPNELMRVHTSHRGTQLPFAAMRLVRDGEVPFIR